MRVLAIVLCISGCTTTQLQGHGVCNITKDSVKFGGFEWRESVTMRFDIAYPTPPLMPFSMKDYFLFEAGELEYGDSSADDSSGKVRAIRKLKNLDE